MLRFRIPLIAAALLSLCGVPIRRAWAEPQLDHTYGLGLLTYNGIKISPDGQRLAVTGSDGVKIYEARTGKVLETRAGCGFQTMSLAWSDDGKSLAAGGLTFDSTLRGEIVVWRDGAKPVRWKTDTAKVVALQFLPGTADLCSLAAGRLYIGDGDVPGAARLWNSRTGTLKSTLATFRAYKGQVGLSKNRQIVVAHEALLGKGAIETFDLRTSKRIAISALKRDETELRPEFFPVQKQGKQVWNLETDSEYLGSSPEPVLTFRVRNSSGKVLGQQKLNRAGGSFDMRAGLLATAYVTLDKINVVDVFRIDGKVPLLKKLTTLGQRTTTPIGLSCNPKTFDSYVWFERGIRTLDARLQPKTSFPFRKGTILGWQYVMSPNRKAVIKLGDGISLNDKPSQPLVNPQLKIGSRGNVSDKELKYVFDAVWRSDGKDFIAVNAFPFALMSEPKTEGVFVFDNQGKWLRSLTSSDAKGHFSPRKVILSPDEKKALVVGEVLDGPTKDEMGLKWKKRSVRLEEWDIDSGTRLRVLDGAGDLDLGAYGQIGDLKYSPSGEQFALSGMLFDKGVLASRIVVMRTSDWRRTTSLPLQNEFHLSYMIPPVLVQQRRWAWFDNQQIVMLKNGAVEKWDVPKSSLLARAVLGLTK